MSPESCLKDVVPLREKRRWLPESLLANADGFNEPERSICRGVIGEPRERPPGSKSRPCRSMDRTGTWDSLIRFLFLEFADHCGVKPVGVDRVTKAPRRKDPWLRRVDPLCARKSGDNR